MTKGPELTRVGITGHMNLTSPTVDLVRDAIRDVLSQYVPGGLTGISCLAAGADTIFALVVAELGGRTMAELTAEEKNRTSHRARAARALAPALMELVNARLGETERIGG